MSEPTEPAEPAEDEIHRKFREALERKRASRGGGTKGTPDANRGVGPSNNDKSTRQFRRKSGG